jgi:hypothetical protein
LNEDDESDLDGDCESEPWTPAQDEACLYDWCCNIYNAEILAYRVPERLLGQGIPKLFATVYTAESEHQKYIDIRGILLEHIDGFHLSELAENAPKPHWQSVCDDAVSIVNAVSDCGILHENL